MRISKVVNDDTQQLIAYKIYRAGAGGSATRMIWMDGRRHPPEYAAHTWAGFSTGHWDGAMITEHIVRHGDVLTIVSIVYDPIYLEEPFIRSTNWRENLAQQLDGVAAESVDEIPGRPEGYVPHHLPGTNKWLMDAAKEFGIPESALRGGRESTYPEYRPK